MSNKEHYVSPLSGRYASNEMRTLFSPQFKYSTWRKLWVALAEAEQELGLPITDGQIEELRAKVDKVNFETADAYEADCLHDVMAHIKAFAEQCPKAAPIIHLGSTSCYVTDNGDLIQIQQALKLLLKKLATVIYELALFADRYRSLPCLGFTHFQPAQLTTVGKRACLWLQDFVTDFHELTRCLESLCFLGAKGATGTQASFDALFNGDTEKLDELDDKIALKMGFKRVYTISGQTYTRKQDIAIFSTLSSFAASTHKFATDIRLLSNLKEVVEGFENNQVGSSAMPYKRNPMLSERLCSLSRFVMINGQNATHTAATQWLERTLDDSANRRIVIPELFLTSDSLLNILQKVVVNLSVNPEVIRRRLSDELPFIATENILMDAVKKGGDRQKLHEKLRRHSHAAAHVVHSEGKENDLFARIADDPAFDLKRDDLHLYHNPESFTGAAEHQVQRFLKEEVDPLFQNSGIKMPNV